MTNTQTYTTKIGLNRGKLRVWLEGGKLSSNGWLRYQTYSQVNDETSITLTKDIEGPKKVAGKTKKGGDIPIIDLTGLYLDFLRGYEFALLTITETTIIVTGMEGDV